jgi:hypothetical protein
MGLALSGHGNDPALTTVDLTGPRGWVCGTHPGYG